MLDRCVVSTFQLAVEAGAYGGLQKLVLQPRLPTCTCVYHVSRPYAEKRMLATVRSWLLVQLCAVEIAVVERVCCVVLHRISFLRLHSNDVGKGEVTHTHHSQMKTVYILLDWVQLAFTPNLQLVSARHGL